MGTDISILIVTGLVVLPSGDFGPGSVAVVDQETLDHLTAAQCATLQFEVVGEAAHAVQPTAPEQVPTETQNSGDEETTDLDAPTTGEGDTLEEVEPEPEHVPAETAQPVATSLSLGLASVDQAVEAALAAAGYATREQLKGATVADLVKVKGIGKARAAAILAEVVG